jgi:hypothetical protein
MWTAKKMGHKGGKISKRVLTPEQARDMVKAREKKRKMKALPGTLQIQGSVILK